MKFGKLYIENFMAIGSAEQNLADRGLVLIQGENKDDDSAKSNGAGKSTIPDALSWCLYGVTARGESGDNIINNNAKSAKVEVIIDIEEEGRQFLISRFRKHPKHKNRLRVIEIVDGDKIDLTLGTDKQTQERVDSIMGCDAEVFNAAIYQGQEKMPDLPRYTDKQLKELVEEASGINILQECLVKARNNRAETLIEKQAIEIRKQNLNVSISTAEGHLENMEQKAKEWLVIHAQEIDDAKGRLKQVKKSMEDAQRGWHDAQPKAEKIYKRKKELQEEIKGKSAYDKKKAEALKAMNEASFTAESDKRNIARKEQALKDRQKKLAEVNNRVGTPCHECGKPILEEDLALVIANIKDDIEGIAVDIIAAKETAAISDNAYAKRLEEFEEIERNEPDLSEIMTKIEKCDLLLQKVDEIKREFDKYHAEVMACQKELEDLEKEESPYEGLVSKHRDEVEALWDEMKTEVKPELEKATKIFEQAEKVVKVFEPAGVRAHIMDHITPFLNSRTAHYLSTLSDGNIVAEWQTLTKTAKGDLREKFTINVASSTGGKSFGLLSGGEKRKVRLACAMALQDVVAQRATKPIELFMADEIDDALDEAGLERLMALLEEKSRERGTVLVISHNSLSDWIRDVMVVTKEGGASTVR